MVLNRNKVYDVYTCKPQFYYVKVGLRGSKLHRHVFVMGFKSVYRYVYPCLPIMYSARRVCIYQKHYLANYIVGHENSWSVEPTGSDKVVSAN